MTDHNRLQDKLAKLSSGETGQDARGRIVQATPETNLLQAMLREIDETILGRSLRLENDRGMVLTLEVASRRLLRLIGLTGFDAGSQYKALLDRVISEEDHAEKQEFIALFQEFTADADTVFVRTEKLNRDVDAADVGVSAEALAKVGGFAMYGSQKSSEPIEPQDFLAICQEQAAAWVSVDGPQGRARETSGKAKDVEQLEGLINTDLAKLNKRLLRSLNVKKSPCAVVFGTGETQKKTVMYLSQMDADWFLLFKDTDAAKLISNWHS